MVQEDKAVGNSGACAASPVSRIIEGMRRDGTIKGQMTANEGQRIHVEKTEEGR